MLAPVLGQSKRKRLSLPQARAGRSYKFMHRNGYAKNSSCKALWVFRSEDRLGKVSKA
jgi:hypothetical protein